MSNIYKAFENKKAFIPFVTGGDPDLETTKNLLIAMEKAGVNSSFRSPLYLLVMTGVSLACKLMVISCG